MLAHGVSESQAFGVEFLASFLVVFVVFACYEKNKYDQQSHAAPFVIGLAYAATIMVTVSSNNNMIDSRILLHAIKKNKRENPAIADKPARRESMPKIAPIRRAYNVVADNTGLSSCV